MMERSLYLYVMKQLAEELPGGLSDRDDALELDEFGRRFEEYLKIGYELNDPENCQVEIYSVMPAIRDVLTDEQYAQLTGVLTEEGEVQLIKVSLFGQPLIETGRFYKCPEAKAHEFGDLPEAIIKGVVKGIVKTSRDNGLTVIDSIQGRAPGKVDVSDEFSRLIREVIDEEVEEACSEMRSKMDGLFTVHDLVSAAPSWGPPSGPATDPLGGGD